MGRYRREFELSCKLVCRTSHDLYEQLRALPGLEPIEPDANFVKTFWTSRTNYSFNKDMFIDALVQYDPATKLLNSNVRFNFIHSPLSDLFIVWNEQRFETGEGIIPGRSLTIKFTKMMAF